MHPVLFMKHGFTKMVVPPFALTIVMLKVVINGLWSDPSKQRYWDLPKGKLSNHVPLPRLRSNLEWMKCVWRWPLHENEFPECGISHSPFWDTKLRNGMKEPAGLTGPPFFSVLSSMSLKSLVRNHASSLWAPSWVTLFQTAPRNTFYGAP